MRMHAKGMLAAAVAATMLVAAVATAETTTPGARYVVGVSGMH